MLGVIANISCVINLFFNGQMEYARLIIISSPVGDLFQSWLFHVLKVFLKHSKLGIGYLNFTFV